MCVWRAARHLCAGGERWHTWWRNWNGSAEPSRWAHARAGPLLAAHVRGGRAAHAARLLHVRRPAPPARARRAIALHIRAPLHAAQLRHVHRQVQV